MLEVNSSKSNNSEDSEENECNANGSKEDDSSFHLEDNKLDKASCAKVTQGLVYSDDEAYLFEVESEDENLHLFSQGRCTQEYYSRWSNKTRCEEHD